MTRSKSATASEIEDRKERGTVSYRVIGKGLSSEVTPEHRLEGVRRARQAEMLRKVAADIGTTGVKSPAWSFTGELWEQGNGGAMRQQCGQRGVIRPVGDEVRGSTACPEALQGPLCYSAFHWKVWEKGMVGFTFEHEQSGCEPETGVGAERRGHSRRDPGKRGM